MTPSPEMTEEELDGIERRCRLSWDAMRDKIPLDGPTLRKLIALARQGLEARQARTDIGTLLAIIDTLSEIAVLDDEEDAAILAQIKSAYSPPQSPKREGERECPDHPDGCDLEHDVRHGGSVRENAIAELVERLEGWRSRVTSPNVINSFELNRDLHEAIVALTQPQVTSTGKSAISDDAPPPPAKPLEEGKAGDQGECKICGGFRDHTHKPVEAPSFTGEEEISPELRKNIEETKAEINKCFDGCPVPEPIAQLGGFDYSHGPDVETDPQGAVNYWQLAANHANEELDKALQRAERAEADAERLKAEKAHIATLTEAQMIAENMSLRERAERAEAQNDRLWKLKAEVLDERDQARAEVEEWKKKWRDLSDHLDRAALNEGNAE
jgi:hypothetical protein